MKIIYKLKPCLILMVFLITFLFCKKSNSKTTNKFLEEKIVQKENKIVLEECDFNKSDIRIALLKDENNEIYLSIKEKGREVIERKLDLENFNELASINLKCSNDDTF